MSVQSQIIAEYAKYRDEADFIHGSINPTLNDEKTFGQNGIRWTAEYAIALQGVCGEIPAEEKVKLHNLRVTNNKGLLWRHPLKAYDQEGPDDYVFFPLICWLTNERSARLRGLKIALENNFWICNNSKDAFHWSSLFFWYQWQLWAHIHFCLREDSPLPSKIWWCIVIWWSAMFTDRDNQDGWALACGLVTAAPDDGIVGWVKRFWIKKFRNAWPRGYGHLMSEYNRNNPDHPHHSWLLNFHGLLRR